MDNWGRWEFSSQGEERLRKICSELDPGKVSEDLLALLNYNISPCSDSCQMETDVNAKEEDVINVIKECVKNETVLSEQTFIDVSINSLERVLSAVESFLDEFGFCCFCKFIACWNDDTLTEHSMRLVVLPKLKEMNEASSCVTFSLKELAISKPDKLSQHVLVPLLTDNKHKFTDVELLSGVLSVLPVPQQDFVMRKFVSKGDFVENDWLLLHLLVKDLSQNSLLCLLECVEKFSHEFTKSQVFGRFLVNFCKNLDFVTNKDALREVVEGHQTLLKNQALKYLETT